MKTNKCKLLNGNQAVAEIAYRTNEVFPIYPITPSSEMSELVEEWSAMNKTNSFGFVPTVIQMQSEAGVAGAMHGALQTGSLSTTFTASQGLLLMLPNMYKIAGELTPNVIHVATRSVATHALSVFGDHSDVMAVRNSGYALLSAASVQEAHDFSLISQAASLQSRIPFIHFFDGFRTSHERSTIELIPEDSILKIIEPKDIRAHYSRALTPEKPTLRGTSQGPDVFFQSREAVNTFYDACPNIMQHKMDVFAKITGRNYKLFDYVGDPKAEYVIITMGSSCDTVEQTILRQNAQGENYGLIKVRLFRPFSEIHLLEALPKSCISIAVLDRTKEPGSLGEPLYTDVTQSLQRAYQNKRLKRIPNIVGGRYGLSSAEFSPGMVCSVLDNLKRTEPKHQFTIGIIDDITQHHLEWKEVSLKTNAFQYLFYGSKNKDEGLEKISLESMLSKAPNNYVQSYWEFDYKKDYPREVLNLRFDKSPINSPYLIVDADFIMCEKWDYLENDNVLKRIKKGGKLLINSSIGQEEFIAKLSAETLQKAKDKAIEIYYINAEKLDFTPIIDNQKVSILNACFFYLNPQFGYSDHFSDLNSYITKINLPSSCKESPLSEDIVFANTLLGKLLSNQSSDIKVSDVPIDGTFQTDTNMYKPPLNSEKIAHWIPDLCVQCGACSLACPLGALRMKVFDDKILKEAPRDFKSTNSTVFENEKFTIQINNDQCNACSNCIDACDRDAISLGENVNHEHWRFFENIDEIDRLKIDPTILGQQQLQPPLFKYADGEKGCGEAPYLKLLSQLFGERLLIANATGASSIFGGALPTTPWSKNKLGQGPAWSNSLFEDNAEFGLGFRLSLNQQEKRVKNLLKNMEEHIDSTFLKQILEAKQANELQISQQKNRVEKLKDQLKSLKSNKAAELLEVCDALIKKSVWCVGGDGWAYDIGYGGLDHVIASGENVNILVLDNQVYSNTGGQMSKATPFGAMAKFAKNGKKQPRKDLGALAMTYDHVYVASVAIGADPNQTLKAFVEAEKFNGPSIIIAYCHSASHGIDVQNPSLHHKAIVNSGQWKLYRRDPQRKILGLLPLQEDSDDTTIKAEEYFKMEKRFKNHTKFSGFSA